MLIICLRTVLFDPAVGSSQVLSLRVRVKLGAITMKRYSAFPKSPRLEPRHQIVSCHIQDIRWGVLSLCIVTVIVFYIPVSWGCRMYQYNKY